MSNQKTKTDPRRKAAAGKAVRQAQRRGMSTNTKLTVSMVAIVVAVLAAVIVVNRMGSNDASAAAVIQADSHRLNTAADGKVTVVEFLDFECPACGAAFPGVEQLRAEYGDRITYAVRYFPIASHRNALTSAHAAEAAARQGKFTEMYKKLFETQSVWANSQQSQAETFAAYARELGLDEAKFRADVDDPAVAARVQADATDGQEVGVQGTPTFFVNGVRFEQQATYASLKSAVEAALAQ